MAVVFLRFAMSAAMAIMAAATMIVLLLLGSSRRFSACFSLDIRRAGNEHVSHSALDENDNADNDGGNDDLGHGTTGVRRGRVIASARERGAQTANQP